MFISNKQWNISVWNGILDYKEIYGLYKSIIIGFRDIFNKQM